MPNTGTPASNSAGSVRGAPSAYTEDGPPDRMIALGSPGEHARSTGIEWRHDLGVDVRLAHPTGDQLRVLGPEVDDEHAVERRSGCMRPESRGATRLDRRR